MIRSRSSSALLTLLSLSLCELTLQSSSVTGVTTSLLQATPASSTQLQVQSTASFVVGSTIRISLGALSQEDSTVTGIISSQILSISGLQNAHAAGDAVSQLVIDNLMKTNFEFHYLGNFIGTMFIDPYNGMEGSRVKSIQMTGLSEVGAQMIGSDTTPATLTEAKINEMLTLATHAIAGYAKFSTDFAKDDTIEIRCTRFVDDSALSRPTTSISMVGAINLRARLGSFSNVRPKVPGWVAKVLLSNFDLLGSASDLVLSAVEKNIFKVAPVTAYETTLYGATLNADHQVVPFSMEGEDTYAHLTYERKVVA